MKVVTFENADDKDSADALKVAQIGVDEVVNGGVKHIAIAFVRKDNTIGGVFSPGNYGLMMGAIAHLQYSLASIADLEGDDGE